MRCGLDLRAADPAARELAGRLHPGVAEPGPLRRRIRLGAEPDIELAGLLVEAFHRRAGVDLGAVLGGLLLDDGGHGFLRWATRKEARLCPDLAKLSSRMAPFGRPFGRGRRGMMAQSPRMQGPVRQRSSRIKRQEDVTPAVLAEIARAPDPRFREIMSAFVRHLHGLAREVKLTEDEFQKAVGYLVALGQRTTESHNEVVLMS